MQREVHRLKIDLKSRCVLLLLSNELLLFVFKSFFLFFELLLGHSRLVFSLFVVFLFGLIEYPLLFERNWRGFLRGLDVVEAVV